VPKKLNNDATGQQTPFFCSSSDFRGTAVSGFSAIDKAILMISFNPLYERTRLVLEHQPGRQIAGTKNPLTLIYLFPAADPSTCLLPFDNRSNEDAAKSNCSKTVRLYRGTSFMHVVQTLETLRIIKTPTTNLLIERFSFFPSVLSARL